MHCLRPTVIYGVVKASRTEGTHNTTCTDRPSLYVLEFSILTTADLVTMKNRAFF